MYGGFYGLVDQCNKRRKIISCRTRTEKTLQAMLKYADDVALSSAFGLYLCLCKTERLSKTDVRSCKDWLLISVLLHCVLVELEEFPNICTLD